MKFPFSCTCFANNPLKHREYNAYEYECSSCGQSVYQYHLGINEYEGYIVFEFDHTPKVLIDCPIAGNAIYVIDEDWERRARLTKQELQADEKVTRIVHQGTGSRESRRRSRYRKL